MKEFQYGIMVNGKAIAWFVNKDDRDRCLSIFEDDYDDCKWGKIKSSDTKPCQICGGTMLWNYRRKRWECACGHVQQYREA